MEFTYRKNDNSTLFSSVGNPDGMNVIDPQNYVPLYHTFFTLSDKTMIASPKPCQVLR